MRKPAPVGHADSRHCFAIASALLLSACIGQSQTKKPEVVDSAGQSGKSTELVACEQGMVEADDGLIDDFEDENTQLLQVAARDGYWWKHADEMGSKFDPDEISLVDHEDGGGFKALHASGTTSGAKDAYGTVVGVNFSQAGPYDAGKYVGIRFKAKADPGALKDVRFQVADVNTHKEGGICKTCWNHFGKNITLSEQWKEYTVLFAELEQAPYWGDPRPLAVVPEQLMAIDWAIGPSGKFGITVDDIRFLACKGAGKAGSSVDLATVERTDLLGSDKAKAFELHGDADKVALSVVPVQNEPFSKALRAEIKEQGSSEWSVQLQAKTSAAVKKGDTLLATFHARYLKAQRSGRAQTQFVFERAGEPYTKSISYPVYLTDQWRKVQVRFKCAEEYGPGEAQMIFRLGYPPQTIEIGGVSVENFHDNVKLLQLPSTEVADLKLRPKPIREPLPKAVDGGQYSLSVDTSKVLRPISPYVYGLNSQRFEGTGATLRRMGGNRQTVYNWELNASNAGNDWKHTNDDWPCTNLGYKDCNNPGAQFYNFVQENKQANIQSLVTIPLIDYVSADKSGPVSDQEAAPSSRFLRSQRRKKSPYSLEPDLTDDVVYQDEFVNFLVQRFGRADKQGIQFYALDNEPALWPSTHPRVHRDRTTYDEIVRRTEELSVPITRIDPSATVLGAVAFGWSEFMSLSGAPDAEKYNKKYGNYLAFYLASMKKLEKKHGRRLVHVLDVHWYPEQRGTLRITENDASLETIKARLQAPRSLWDPTYHEKTWIGDSWGKPVRLFRWLAELVEQYYPGTKLALTEYNFGTGDHISGALAEIDVLGILGREGVYIGNYWGNGPGVGALPKYIKAAFQLYRNYDGNGGVFGDAALSTTAPDIEKVSIYAAQRKKDGRLTVLVINKDLRHNVIGKIKLDGGQAYVRAIPYVVDESSARVQKRPAVAIQANVISYKLPRLSATLFVCDPK